MLAILITGDKDKLTIGQERLMEAYANLAAVAIESILLNEEAHNAQILRDTEKLQTALLNSVSHDLRTPSGVNYRSAKQPARGRYPTR